MFDASPHLNVSCKFQTSVWCTFNDMQGRPAQTWPCLCSEIIPSGALTLDIALGGGFPKGRIIEVPSSIPASLEFADALASAVQASTPKLCSDRSSLSNVNSEHASIAACGPLLCPSIAPGVIICNGSVSHAAGVWS